jgi:hypothetical protein
MGTDRGACACAAPSKTFAFALTQTAAGGEIDVLDPAGYGMVTITKAISIVNDGVGAATIGTSLGNGVTINAGAGDSVHRAAWPSRDSAPGQTASNSTRAETSPSKTASSGIL